MICWIFRDKEIAVWNVRIHFFIVSLHPKSLSTMNWIERIINRSTSISTTNNEEQKLIEELVRYAFSLSKEGFSIGTLLAAFYDLAIAAVYYTNITNVGWLYCKDDSPRLILPYINCCPIHALKGEFIFHRSSKPTSAIIGQATARVLLLFYQEIFKVQQTNIRVNKAPEPADAIFIDSSSKNVYFAEIKSSPLLTPALSMNCDEMTEYSDNGDITPSTHQATSNPNILNNELFLVIPKKNKSMWEPTFHSIGMKQNTTDTCFAYKGIRKLIANIDFMETYLEYWKQSFSAYCKKDETENIFWLTNACGKPSSLGDEWQGGVTCISDEKTSVGMDRTDDIKKGINQVLKLGSEGKIIDTEWNYKIGILSNIHPARHFDVYLKPIKDMIWTITEQTDVKFAQELNPTTPMYNLFDGIITFTRQYVRDSWISRILKCFNDDE